MTRDLVATQYTRDPSADTDADPGVNGKASAEADATGWLELLRWAYLERAVAHAARAGITGDELGRIRDAAGEAFDQAAARHGLAELVERIGAHLPRVVRVPWWLRPAVGLVLTWAATSRRVERETGERPRFWPSFRRKAAPAEAAPGESPSSDDAGSS